MDTEKAGMAIKTLSKKIMKLHTEGKKGSSVFERYGITVLDASGKMLSTETILGNVADKFKQMPSGLERTRVATDLFGKSGQEMIRVLSGGEDVH